MKKIVLSSMMLIYISSNLSAASCDIRLKSPVPVCPAVVYSIDDCDASVYGKKGDKFSPLIIHVMENGSVFACESHVTCVELKNLKMSNCTMTFLNRSPEESKEYASHLLIR